jgi:hypothetical protein
MLECFKSANFLQLSQYVKQDELQIWMTLTASILQKGIPDDQMNRLEDWNEIYERQEESYFW